MSPHGKSPFEGGAFPNTFGKYRLSKRLAYGGMAEVFLGTVHGEAGFSKPIVIKRLHPQLSADSEFVNMLVDEARITAQLTHTNIAQVLDLGAVDGAYYLAMEHVAGEELRALQQDFIANRQPFPTEAAVYIVAEVLSGLEYAHLKEGPEGEPLNIIHRDVSPQNVMVSYEGEVKVIDFGIAKARSRMVKTQAGVIKGKFRYMSPEQAMGEQIDHRTDIFAAGVVLYELLSGQPHLIDVPDTEALRRMREVDLEPLDVIRDDLPKGLVSIVHKAMARKVKKRYQSAGAFRAELMEYLRGLGLIFSRTELGDVMRNRFSTKRRMDRGGSSGAGRVTAPPRSVEATHNLDSSQLETDASYSGAAFEATVHSGMRDALASPEITREPTAAYNPDQHHDLPSAAFTAQKTNRYTRDEPPPRAPFPKKPDEAIVDARREAPRREPRRQQSADRGPRAEDSRRSVERGPIEQAPTQPDDEDRRENRSRGGAWSREQVGAPAASRKKQPPYVPPSERPPEPHDAAAAPRQPEQQSSFRAEVARSAARSIGRWISLIVTMTILGAILLGGVYVAKRMGLFNPDDSPKTAQQDASPGSRDIGGASKRTSARVRVKSRPSRAAIFICGKATNKRTPATISVPAGRECTLEVRLRGYASGKQLIYLEAGEMNSYQLSLRRLKRSRRKQSAPDPAAATDTAALIVTSIKAGVVFVNGRRVGKTPRLSLSLTPGTYTVRVKFLEPGLSSETKEVYLRGGERRSVHFDVE